MKKKITTNKKPQVKKTTPRRTVHHSRKNEQSFFIPFSFQRIVLVTTAFALFFVAIFVFTKPNVQQSVAGVSIAKGLFNQATVTVPQIANAKKYNIYYKQISEKTFTNAVRGIPPGITNYTISYLKKGQKYQYKIAALNANGQEFWWSQVIPLTNLQSM
jgi:hypothetical protein